MEYEDDSQAYNININLIEMGVYCNKDNILVFSYDTGCPTKHDSWWIVLNVFFHNLLISLIQKGKVRNIITWQSFYIENWFQSKIYLSKRVC